MSADAENQAGAELDSYDAELFQKALIIIREEQKISASMLQRRLRIGYVRAARILDALEVVGYIAPQKLVSGTAGREILPKAYEYARRAPTPVAALVPGERAREIREELIEELRAKFCLPREAVRQVVTAILSRHLPTSPDTLTVLRAAEVALEFASHEIEYAGNKCVCDALAIVRAARVKLEQ